MDSVGGRRPASDTFRPDIQGLRAVAVLLVALNHAHVPHLGGGYVGVDVFFVISGFLITGWLVRRASRVERMPFREFYAARARRILPAATLVLVVTVLASWYFLNFVRALSAFHDALWAAVFAANIHFAQVGTNYFAQDNPPSPLQHFWTLAVEEQFYIVWPALLAVALYVVRGRRRAGHPSIDAVVLRRLAVVVAACVLASLAWSIHETATNPTAAYFSTLARGWELGIGALMAVCTVQLMRLPVRMRIGMTWLGLAGIAVAATVYSSQTPFPGSAALLPVLAAAMVIAGGLGGEPQGAVRILRVRPMRVIGDVSYTFYLWHWPFLIIAAQYEGHALSVMTNLGLLAVALAVSIFTYAVYEYPIRHSDLFSRPLPALALWPVTVSAVVLVAGYGITSIDAGYGAPTPVLKIVPKALDRYTAAVAASVTPATGKLPIPGNLIPSVLELSRDGPSGCVTRTALGRRCTLGDPRSRRRIVIFGDSHAAAWLPAVQYYARTRGLALVPIVMASCTMGVASAPGHCHDWFESALERIKSLHPRAIIVGQYFDPRIPKSAMYAGVSAEVRAFARIAPRVVVLQDPPRHVLNPVDCLLGHGATLGTCTFSLTGEQMTEYATVQQLATAAGAQYVHTLQWFCAGGRCPLVVGRLIVYWDTNHMSTTYSRELAVPLRASLSGLLR